MMLTYEEFKNRIEKEIHNRMGEDTEITYQTVHKINRVTYEGMFIRSKQWSPLPVFPIEPCYRVYCKGLVDMDEILRMVTSRTHESIVKMDNFIYDIQHGSMTKNIYMRVVNFEMNEEWLAGYPHRRRLDLAIMYYIGTEDKSMDMSVANITYGLMKIMGLSEEELYHLAYENSIKKQPAKIKKIKDTFPKILWDMASEMLGDNSAVSEADDLMYVLTNPKKKLGAVCMFYEGVFEELAESLQDDLFILPSSTHEVMIVPCEGLEAEKLQEIVKEVNRTSVGEDEVLGERVYTYRKNEKIIEIYL